MIKFKKEQLLKFLKSYAEWAGYLPLDIVSDSIDYSPGQGLCSNCYILGDESGIAYAHLKAKLSEDFPDNPHYPFNDAYYKPYHQEVIEQSIPMNPFRKKWVMNTIEQLKVELASS